MEREQVSLRGTDVTIGFPCGVNIPWQTAMSLAAAVRVATKMGVDVRIQTIAGNSDVVDARNAVFSLFMDSDSTRLFWIDSDIDFRPDAFLRMLALSQKYDIVAGAYPLKRPDQAVVLNDMDGTQWEMNRDGLLKIKSLGLGFTIVRREPLEKLAEGKLKSLHPTANRTFTHVFRQTETAGEDICFFNDLRALGYDVWLDPTIELGHIGPFVYKRDVIAALKLEKYYTPKE